MMADIDIGSDATDRGGSLPANSTFVTPTNPANGTGTIAIVKMWALVNMTDVKVGTFHGVAPNFTNRDFATIGNVTAGSEQTFTELSIDVQTGDFIGIHYTAGRIDSDSPVGDTLYLKAGDQMGQGLQAYGTTPNPTIVSLYGESAAAAADEVVLGGGSKTLHDWKKFPELSMTQINEFGFESPHVQITEDFRAEVIKVIDGDTIRLRTEFRDFDFPLRFLNINAPEMNEGGEVTKAWLKNRIEGKQVDININPRNRVDKFGRLLGSVFVDGLDVGDEELRGGLAEAYGSKDGEIPDPKLTFAIKQWL